MRKKFTMLLASLFLVMGTAWAQTAELKGSTTVATPEFQYVLKSGNNYWMAANTAPTKHALGRFAFFAVTETANDANDYKIYSIDLQKWVSYNKAGSYSDGKDFAKLVDNQGDAQPWNVVKKTVSDVDYYQIAPYNNTSVAAKYMNWYGGINASGYSYDDDETAGLYSTGASNDAGSRWTLAECLDLGSIADGGDIATTWTPSSWWTTADHGGSNVLSAVKAVEDAQYPAGTSDVKMSYMHIVLPAGRLDITLNYSTGNNRLDILGLDLLNANGEVVVSDYHFGYTGNAKSLNTYTLPVETAGSYSLRYWVTFKSQPNNSDGNIAIAHTSVAELKEAAKAELEDLAKLSFMTVGDAVAQVDAVAENPNAAINAILVNVKKSADDKNLTFKNHGSGGRDGRYLGYDKANNRAAVVDPTSKEVIWTIKVQENGSFKLYNYIYDVYLGVPADPTPVISTEADAPAFDFIVKDNNKVALVTGGKMAHVANHTNYKLIQYYDLNDGASLWTITQTDDIAVTRELYNQAVAAKVLLPYATQQAYGLVTDASKYSSNAPETDPAEGSSFDNLLDNNYSSYFHSAWSYGVDGNHYLQAEVSEEVKDFCFYFKKRHNTNNSRPTEIDILGSTDGEEFTLITTINNDLPTNENEIDYFSAKITAENNVKHLRFVVKNTNTPDKKEENDNPYFHFSEFYIFPAMFDITNLIESYKNFATISITDDAIVDAANKLINAETTLALANIKKEANSILTANADKHEETPALGKYPTATYEALQNAYNNGTTEVEIRTAIDNFKASKNLPVFTIDGVIDYARGKSIYDNPGSTNAKGNTHYFKTTNEFDKTMWWALDLTAVDLTDSKINSPKLSVGIYNVGTGAGFWGASTIDITETSENDATDDIFLFYANGGNPIHAQKDGALITKWESQGKGSGSAWKFSYIGSTFELSKYDDAYVAAYAALETAYIGKRHLIDLFGPGVGQFGEGSEAFLAPLTDGGELLNVPLGTLLKEKTIADLQSATEGINNMQAMPDNVENSLNLPKNGQYFRIKGANADAANYLTGNVTVNGSHIALQADKTNATIFRYVNNKLLAVESNLYVAMTANFYTFQILEKNAPNITFAASSRKAGAYTINSGCYFHYNSNNNEGTFLDRCSSDEGNANHTAHDWYLEEVAESEVPANTNLLTDITNLSAEASYRIYGDRGFIYVADDGNMKGTNVANVAYNPNNDKHHFAIVTIGENKYLYNVGAKKFVMKKNNGVTLTDWPEQAITIEGKTNAGSNVGYDWVIKLGDNLLNLSTGGGHTDGVFTNHNTEDPGNVWAIYKVGSFAPAEASSIKKVTVNYNVEGQTFTKNYGVAADNAISFDYDFATVTSCKVGEEAQEITDGACSVTVLDNMTIAVVIDEDLPFEAARAENNIPASAWLYLQMHSNNKKYIEYLSDNQKIEWADASVERAGVNTHTWALVGNVVEGFKLVNYAATSSKALKSTGSGSPTMDSYANGTAFVLANTTQSVEGGFCLQYPGGQYLNAGATLQHWGSADAGSTLVATKSPAKLLEERNTLLTYAATVVTIENDKTAALQTAIEDAQNSAATDYATVEGQITALNTAIDNVIKAKVGAGLFRLKNSASGFYMTIVTPEAAEGIKIKEKDESDATKQAFYIEPTAEVGVYNIKSTENYFMASSGSWNYGAYQTANEAGRAHKVEYLGNGKYALKTLLGYAGPNKNATSDGSPLYSNHTADNNGREWELEELPKSSITYIYKYGEEEITREVHENVYEGLAAPATAVTLPFGFSYDPATLPTTKGAGNQEVEIACTLSLPFEYASEYAAITKWYYLKIHATDQNYLYYDSNNAAQLDATKTEVDAANKDAYTWAFIGDPIHGFQVVNKLSTEGNLLYLNATETNPSVGTETHVWALTSSTYAGNGFFMACSTEGAASAERLNKNQSAGIVTYWSGADGGSTFLLEERDLSGASELQEYINNVVNPLLTELGDGTATAVGYVTKDSYEALVAAKDVAQAAVDSRENVNEAQIALQVAVHGLKTIQPTAGTYYFIQNTQTNAYMSVVAGTGLVSSATAGLGELFQFVAAADGKFYLYNVERGTYLSTAKLHDGGQNFAGAVETTSAKAVTITNLGATNEVSIIPDGGVTMHHDSNLGTIVGWNDEKGSKSSWKIVEADLTGLTRTVTVGDLGYSTLYLNYATIVPEIEGEDNGVYVASEVASNYVALTQVEAGHVLPAKTGVIIKATKGNYTFTYSSKENNNVTSAFEGTLVDEIITPAAKTTYYVLANGNNGVGLYKAKMNRYDDGSKVPTYMENGTRFLNNANKVYLPVVTSLGQNAPALVMRFGRGQGTTEIELPTANGQQPTAVYDLQGRRVLNPTKGMYIINGKKVVIR